MAPPDVWIAEGATLSPGLRTPSFKHVGKDIKDQRVGIGWIGRLRGRSSTVQSTGRENLPPQLDSAHTAHAETAMQCALSFALQAQEWRFHFVEHCARVALTARYIADRLSVTPKHAAALHHAAEMHEVGMVAVPHELIRRPYALNSTELQQVRTQARVGARIVGAAYEPLKAAVVENQYASFADLRRRLSAGSPELVLAGILRVADVYDTLLHPRPYQRDIPKWRWLEVLEGGMGSSFYPEAAEVLLRRPPPVLR